MTKITHHSVIWGITCDIVRHEKINSPIIRHWVTMAHRIDCFHCVMWSVWKHKCGPYENTNVVRMATQMWSVWVYHTVNDDSGLSEIFGIVYSIWLNIFSQKWVCFLLRSEKLKTLFYHYGHSIFIKLKLSAPWFSKLLSYVVLKLSQLHFTTTHIRLELGDGPSTKYHLSLYQRCGLQCGLVSHILYSD